MFTISDIIADIDRICMIHNMNENKFTYRVIFFINDGNKGTKHYVDTTYEKLRRSLEDIIRENLSTTNSIVIANVTTLKGGKSIFLLSRSYAFCLDDYFDRVTERCEAGNKKRSNMYGNTYRKKVCNWC